MGEALLLPAAADLLRWYDRHRRTMPWRAAPGEAADPYRVWLSEIMLQQTTVAAVAPRYRRFLERFSTVGALAAAGVDEVMQEWAGLGYYARARNLHACAKAVVAAGGFPRDLAGLRALPGVGDYTAAAVASIAFAQPVIAIDGNVERVAARVFGIDEPLPGSRRVIGAAARRLGEDAAARARPADYTQALFDLGATVCTPRNPACVLCPWSVVCVARRGGEPERLPAKAPRRVRPVRHGAAFWLEDRQGRVLLRRRPPTGLLGGLLELPGTEWRPARWAEQDALAEAPQRAGWRLAGEAAHGFTHFELRLAVFRADVRAIEAEGTLHDAGALEAAGLPTAMMRCVEVARGAVGVSPHVKVCGS